MGAHAEAYAKARKIFQIAVVKTEIIIRDTHRWPVAVPRVGERTRADCRPSMFKR